LAYTGKSFVIDCSRGGFCGLRNIDAIPAEMMIEPSRNVNINVGVRKPRGGTSKLYPAAFSGAPHIMGLYKFRLANATEFIMAATKDGKLYKNATTTIKTGMSTSDYFSFETILDTLFVADGATQVQTWNGVDVATADITTPALDWGGAYDYPFQVMQHMNGNSRRLFALNKDALYWCIGDTPTDFNGTGSGVIYGDTGDGIGFVGMIEFGKRLFVFGKTQVWYLDDSDIDISKWALVPVQWEGGVAHWRLLVKTKNNLYAATESGDIYSVSTTQAYGDYYQASIAVPAGIHEWIQDNVSLGNIDKAHAVFDSQNRMVKWFFPRSGDTPVSVCLPFCVDRQPQEAWGCPHDNVSSPSGYNASVSVNIRESMGIYRVYTGDYSGNVWKTEMTSIDDDGHAYIKGFDVPTIFADSPRTTKHFNDGWVVMEPEGNYTLSAHHWADGIAITNTTNISEGGTGGVLDSFILDVDVLGGQEVVDGRFHVKHRAKRIRSEFFNTGIDQTFSISKILYDFKPVGVRQ